MIQVLGLRDFLHKGIKRKREVFFQKGWRFASIQDVFDVAKREALLAKVPPEERYNLYFTAADCFEERGRKLKEQWVIPFDIDNLAFEPGEELQVARKVAAAALKTLNVPLDEAAVVFSGNGVQFFVGISEPIVSEEYFETTRLAYAAICQSMQRVLVEKMLPGKVDTSVFSKGRLMRLPDTLNRKENKPERMAVVLNDKIVPRSLDLVAISGIAMVEHHEHVPDEVLKNYPKPDTKAILEGCRFLNWCGSHQAAVSEPQWYAMLSVTARLDDGREVSHVMSAEHPGYNHYEAELKIDQALTSSGPRTCRNIEALWEGCKECPHYEKITSPIMIKGPDYIASQDFGFRERRTDKNGVVRPGPPAYLDLIKEFSQQQAYKTVSDNKNIYIYNGKFWEKMYDQEAMAWMAERVKPAPSSSEAQEFLAQLKLQNLTRLDWFSKSRQRMMNFQNVVLDLTTMEVHAHKPEFGFFHVLPFDYDPRALAPRWEQFLLEIMQGDRGLVDLLKEFGGYAISGDDYWIHKALLLVGDGSNGKSVFMEMLGEVAGKESHSAVPVQQLNDPVARQLTYNKLFNYSEETSVTAFNSSEAFKTMASGGALQYKVLYEQPFMAHNRAKMIMSANNMPYSADKSLGIYRRLLIVRFRATFLPDQPGFDYFLKDKLRRELPGICNSLIEGYRRLLRNQKFSAEEITRSELNEYMYESDAVLRFKLEYLQDADEDPDAFETTSDMYLVYTQMCLAENERPLTLTSFGHQLLRVWPVLKERKTTRRVDGKPCKGFLHVHLKKAF